MEHAPAAPSATPTNVSDRIQQLLDYYGLNVNKATQKLGYSTTSKLYKILKGAEPSYPTLVDFLAMWPEVSAEWLLMGRGGMFGGKATDEAPSSAKRGAEETKAGQRALANGLRVLAVTVDKVGNDNTILIPARAQAGYTRSYNEAAYLEQMRPYQIPGFEHGSYRAFEVNGDSMEPTINHRDIVVCSYVDRWDLLKPGEIYVVVTHENILLKRIPRRITDRKGMVDLLSDNTTVKPYDLPAADIVELWMVLGYISTYIPSRPNVTVERLWEVIELLGHDRGEVKRYLQENAAGVGASSYDKNEARPLNI
ncbi:LexA family transcriptional regulator [Hymenobacter gummosus]|uniref:LexA family transcriptional regulator n=1 Tax=Hymenobacter gummosus TaxID=1776032 RepID=A0A431TVM1_9BACT|nr:LexA family transcriptional regulator [Hymenobacter gummosus]